MAVRVGHGRSVECRRDIHAGVHRVVRSARALHCLLARDALGREQVPSWHLAYLLMRPTCQPTAARWAGTSTGLSAPSTWRARTWLSSASAPMRNGTGGS